MKYLQRPLLLLLLFAMAGLQLHAQDSKIKKANELFEEFSFPEAAEAYKKLLAKTPDVAEAKIKLADCYRLMNMPVEAEYWYAQVVELPESEPIHKYHYGMALKANGKFDQGKSYFLEYAQLVPADTRGLRQVEACEQATYFLTDPGIYQITLASTVNSELADFGPAFYRDGIVYASEKNVKFQEKEYNWREHPFLDLFYSKAEGENPANLAKPELFKGKVNTWVHEGTVTFTEDFQTMYFTRNNYFKGKIGYDTEEEMKTVNLQIYESKAVNGGEKWGDIESLPFNSDDYSVGHPALSRDGQALYFASDMPGGFGETDLYVSYKSGDSWGQPENLGPEINTEGREMFPYMSADGTLYFASDALPGLGGLDIFSAKLLEDGTWSAPENLRYPINTNGDDFAFIINHTNESGYFSSNRPGGKGDDDIYSFTKLNNVMTGIVVDCETQEPISDALVKLIENGQVMQKKKSVSNGTFSFPISPEKDYEVVATKLGYEEGSQSVSTYGMDGTQVNVKIPLCVEGGSGNMCEVRGVITDRNSGSPVSGAIVKLTNLISNEEQTFVTGADGVYYFELPPKTDYTLHATKDFYFTEIQTVSTVGVDCKDPMTKDFGLDIPLGPIPVDPENVINNGNGPPTYRPDPNNPPVIRDNGQGTDWGPSGLVLHHIYFDFDKDNIRPDAAAELDKIVAFLYNNPGVTLDLRSHTDSRGSHAYNQDLSQRRAESTRRYLIERGVDPSRLTSATGYGESQLFNECADGVKCSEAKHQENRRTEFAISGYTPLPYSLPRYFGTGGTYSGPSGGGSAGSYGISDTYTAGGSGNTYYDSGSSGSNSYYDGGSYSSGSSYTTGSTYTTPGGSSGGGTYYDSSSSYGGSSSSGGVYNANTSGGVLDCCVPGAGTEYKIQLGVYQQPDLSEYSNLIDMGLLDVESTGAGTQRVVLGKFGSQQAAEEALFEVRQRGFNDAFVVKYQDGLRVGR